MALTNKQAAFVESYLQCFNATKAAIEAGYSKKTAYSIGWENLRKPEIEQEIQKRLDANAMSADEVLSRLAQLARLNIEDFFDFEVGLPFFNAKKAKKAGVLHLVAGIEHNQHGTKYKFKDSLKALELIGKTHGLFAEKVEQDVSGKVTIEVVRRNGD